MAERYPHRPQEDCRHLVEGEGLPDGRYALIVGIGINISAMPGQSALPRDLPASAGVPASPEELFAHLFAAAAEALEIWDRARGVGEITALWRAIACGIGEKITVNLPDRSISGNSPESMIDGLLMLDTGAGRIMPIAAGDVFFG